MRVLFASSEVYPLAKSGGLADAAAALPRALADLGVDVHLILPAYPQALAHVIDASEAVAIERDNGRSRLIRARMPDGGLPVWLVDAPDLFDRRGSLYKDDSGVDWTDNAQRFAFFSSAAARLAGGALVPGWSVDLVHANDWHTGLIPLYLAGLDIRLASVFTIHNLAYQGLFPQSVLPSLRLPDGVFTPDGIEFYGQLSFIKAGIRFSDWVTTVSPSYAHEILTEEFGRGLDGLLRHRISRLSGILNGVDYDIWNPATDPHLPAPFGCDDLAGKRRCKTELQRELGLTVDPDVPLLIWLSRITDQKMADVVSQALHLILERDVQLAMLGDGDRALEGHFRDAEQHYPGRLSVGIGYQEALAHRLQAGADMLLHPCRFEPCGLTPLYAMRYGVLPIVRHVGGLTDTIVDATEWTIRSGSATGFAFREANAPAMLDCIDRALAFFVQPEIWRRMQHRAMTRQFGWDVSARRYLALYRKLVAGETEQVEPPSRQPALSAALMSARRPRKAKPRGGRGAAASAVAALRAS